MSSSHYPPSLRPQRQPGRGASPAKLGAAAGVVAWFGGSLLPGMPGRILTYGGLLLFIVCLMLWLLLRKGSRPDAGR